MQTLTLFVSSPGDVRDERQAVGRIVERLQARYWNFIRLEPVLWEKEPLRATAHFNEELIRPSDCDLFVCILWSRLGSPLPSQFNRKDGTRFDSGTEWELEEATEAYEERAAAGKDGKDAKAKPDILVYRRMSDPPPGGDAGAKREQKKKLDAFCERFFFNKDKTIRRAFSPYETTDEFMALFEQHLEKLLLRHIRLQSGLAEDAVRPLPLEGSPFKGLGTFDFEDAPLFFGRNRPIAEALAKLKENHAAGHAFLLIYGGSGYGKSSLMRAGLAPRLTADGYLPDVGEWCGTCLLPVEGDSPPLETLARAIVEAIPDLGKLRDTSGKAASDPALTHSKKKRKGHKPQPASAHSPKSAEPVWDTARLARMLAKPEDLVFAIAAIVAGLDRVRAGKPAHLLILIDQLEEIFTAGDVTAEMRDAYFQVLAALAMSRRVWVVATMRSEFFPRVPEHRDLFQLVRHGGGYILSPPELPELHQIIRYPALAAGLQFERHPETGRDLSEQIYQDAADAHDALPLLEFTLEELYQRRRENVLAWAAYEELGGLAGAIARRAQETYDALPSETRREAAKQIFGELVTLDAAHEGPATRRRAKLADLREVHPGAPAFLTAFIEAKLLVTGSEHDTATVTLAHEALITHWPVLRQWIEDHRDLLLARRRLEDSTRLWTDGNRSPRFFLTEGRLAEAERVATSGVFRLGDDENELVRLSRLRARRKLRIFQGATAVFAVLAVGAGALGVVARNKQRQAEVAEDKANASAAETRRSLAAADFDSGAARVAAGAPDEALPYLLASLESDPANLDAQALLLETLRHTAWNFPEITLKHPQPVRMLSFGADRDTLFAATDTSSSAEGFNTTLRWDLAKPAISSMLAPHWGEITLTLSTSPVGKHVLIQRGYKAADDTFLCDGETMQVIARLPVTKAHPVPATCFAWSPDGALFAYPADPDPGSPGADSHFTWRIIDATTGQTVRESEALPKSSAAPIAAQLDRTRLRAVAADGAFLEMPIRPDAPTRHEKIEPEFDFAIFSPDGERMLAAIPGDEFTKPSHAIVEFREDTGKFDTHLRDVTAEDGWAAPAALAERFPWSSWDSPFWKGMYAASDGITPPLLATGSLLEISGAGAARMPVRAGSKIEAVASSGSRLAVGSASGELTIYEVLAPLGHQLPPATEQAGDEGESGWMTAGENATYRIQSRGRDWRLRTKEGDHVTALQRHPGWMYTTDVALPSDGAFTVQAGFSAGSGGYSAAGMVVCDTTTGEILSDLEPVSEIRGVSFLGDRHRVAAMGAMEVIIADVDKGGFRRVATLPVVDARALHHIAGRDLLAVATVDSVRVFDARDFSPVMTLPLAQASGARDESWDQATSPAMWAYDASRDWLAYHRGTLLHAWSLRSGRQLVGGFTLPSANVSHGFTERDGMVGLALTGAVEAFVPLARLGGLDASQLATLRAFSETVAGTRFADGSRALASMPSAKRHELAKSMDAAAAESLLPGAKDLLAKLAAHPPRASTPATWEPVWQRLTLGKGESQRIARWAADLGTDHPWFRSYVRGLIARSDDAFFTWLRGETPAGHEENHEDPLPNDPEIGHLHRLAGDPAATTELKRAAWQVLRISRAGKTLVTESDPEEFPGIDFAALEKLDPATLAALRKALDEGEQSDWRIKLIDDELGRQPAAVALLDGHVASTLATWDAENTPEHAIAHAEALALRGEVTKAAEFLAGKIPDDAALTLEQAHFLIASRLASACPVAVERSLEALGSPWLRAAWVAMPSDEPLAEKVARTMTAVAGEGPAAIAAMQAALRANDPAALVAALGMAKDLPGPVREYATARTYWAEGKKAEVFAMWPEVPDFGALESGSDWHGWESLMGYEETNAFLDEIDRMAATLHAAPDASVEDLTVLGELLLQKETTADFGVKRVRDALVTCALALADDAGSADLVTRMVDHARLAGASHPDCLRIEARSFMAQGDFTAAYARWLLLIDSERGEIVPNDYLYAAQCVLEDMQDVAAIELLNRGKARFAADVDFAYDSAWLLLTTAHPEEAGIMLEHGFKIPFTEDQTQTATAMLVCAAEQTGRTERADEAFQDLIILSPEWGEEKSVESLEWPDDLTQILLSVAKRSRGEAEPEEAAPKAIEIPEEDGDSGMDELPYPDDLSNPDDLPDPDKFPGIED
ncbi:hypothetical protein OKA04_22425 [Luteolibacter flavescens]|uniref:Novel STAND NTPase 1 domain-containing protein n=1 Tax=Luteolibacter flavescens TaxID=1859460 RepID=A0ABT3FWA1_9BACT|nr:hypothetical protein [Luteolibacter flavescens]MCW1887509.1 hypothetical protein [Luteolibacter flavescens]